MKYIFKCICVLCLIGYNTTETPILQNSVPNEAPILQHYVSYDTTEIKLPVADYVVKKIIREKKNLYIIDLERSDSVFRIFSHFDGKRNVGDEKIHKHDRVSVELIKPSEYERETMWDNPYLYVEVLVELYGVTINKYLKRFRYSYDFEVCYCNDLNGLYLRCKKE